MSNSHIPLHLSLNTPIIIRDETIQESLLTSPTINEFSPLIYTNFNSSITTTNNANLHNNQRNNGTILKTKTTTNNNNNNQNKSDTTEVFATMINIHPVLRTIFKLLHNGKVVQMSSDGSSKVIIYQYRDQYNYSNGKISALDIWYIMRPLLTGIDDRHQRQIIEQIINENMDHFMFLENNNEASSTIKQMSQVTSKTAVDTPKKGEEAFARSSGLVHVIDPRRSRINNTIFCAVEYFLQCKSINHKLTLVIKENILFSPLNLQTHKKFHELEKAMVKRSNTQRSSISQPNNKKRLYSQTHNDQSCGEIQIPLLDRDLHELSQCPTTLGNVFQCGVFDIKTPYYANSCRTILFDDSYTKSSQTTECPTWDMELVEASSLSLFGTKMNPEHTNWHELFDKEAPSMVIDNISLKSINLYGKTTYICRILKPIRHDNLIYNRTNGIPGASKTSSSRPIGNVLLEPDLRFMLLSIEMQNSVDPILITKRLAEIHRNKYFPLGSGVYGYDMHRDNEIEMLYEINYAWIFHVATSKAWIVRWMHDDRASYLSENDVLHNIRYSKNSKLWSSSLMYNSSSDIVDNITSQHWIDIIRERDFDETLLYNTTARYSMEEKEIGDRTSHCPNDYFSTYTDDTGTRFNIRENRLKLIDLYLHISFCYVTDTMSIPLILLMLLNVFETNFSDKPILPIELRSQLITKAVKNSAESDIVDMEQQFSSVFGYYWDESLYTQTIIDPYSTILSSTTNNNSNKVDDDKIFKVIISARCPDIISKILKSLDKKVKYSNPEVVETYAWKNLPNLETLPDKVFQKYMTSIIQTTIPFSKEVIQNHENSIFTYQLFIKTSNIQYLTSIVVNDSKYHFVNCANSSLNNNNNRNNIEYSNKLMTTGRKNNGASPSTREQYVWFKSELYDLYGSDTLKNIQILVNILNLIWFGLDYLSENTYYVSLKHHTIDKPLIYMCYGDPKECNMHLDKQISFK